MRKYFIDKFIGWCLVVLFISCNSDDDNGIDCPGQLGEMETIINGQTIYQARWTLFEYFNNGALSVSSFVQDQNCLGTASMTFTAEPNLDRQDFVITDAQFIREPTNIIFFQINEDTALGQWEIVEGEPNWVQFDEITETSVTGRFQATLVVEDTGNDFHTLPDTLRFDNVSFKAVPGELLNGSN